MVNSAKRGLCFLRISISSWEGTAWLAVHETHAHMPWDKLDDAAYLFSLNSTFCSDLLNCCVFVFARKQTSCNFSSQVLYVQKDKGQERSFLSCPHGGVQIVFLWFPLERMATTTDSDGVKDKRRLCW